MNSEQDDGAVSDFGFEISGLSGDLHLRVTDVPHLKSVFDSITTPVLEG